MSRHPLPTRRRAGFTYVGALIAIAVVGIASVETLQAGAALQRHAAEEELLAIGTEFTDAFISYANATAPGKRRTPATLDDLLRDPRSPQLRRHLRRIYVDPLTREANWGLLEAPGGGLAGVYSMAASHPLKVANFPLRFQHFEGAADYRTWEFRAPADVIEPRNAGKPVRGIPTSQ